MSDSYCIVIDTNTIEMLAVQLQIMQVLAGVTLCYVKSHCCLCKFWIAAQNTKGWKDGRALRGKIQY